MARDRLGVGTKQETSGSRDWDQLSKVGVRFGLPRLLQMVGEVVDPGELVAATVELPGTALRADLVYTTARGLVIHVEIQHRPVAGMVVRMLAYLARLLLLYPRAAAIGEGVVQIVVQVTGAPMPSVLVTPALSYRFHLVHVPTADPADLLADPGLAAFVATRGDADLAPGIVEAIRRLPELEDQVKLLTLAVDLDPGDTLLSHIQRRGDMTDVYDRVAGKLRDTPIAQAWLAEGREEGREEGLATAVLDILTTRHPTMDADRLQTLAVRLVREHGTHAASVAVTLTAGEIARVDAS